MLGFSFSLPRSKGNENQAWTERHAKWKPLQQRTFFHACPACPFAQRLDTVWEVFGTSFSGQSRWWNLSWKIRANSSALLVSLPANEATYACPMAQGLETLASLGRTVFRKNRTDEICPENPCQQLCIFSVAPCQWSYACPNGALPKLFPTLSPPSTLRPRSSPRAISHGLLSVSPCPRYHLAPSQRSSPQAISHGFPSVHPVVASISLLPHGALPELFPAVSPPSTLSSLPSCSLPTELSPSYFPRLPLRPPCRRFGIASLAAK